MDLEKIAGLVKIIEDSSLTEFSYEDEELKVKMSKLDHPPVVATGVPAAPMAAGAHRLAALAVGIGAVGGDIAVGNGHIITHHISIRRRSPLTRQR